MRNCSAVAPAKSSGVRRHLMSGSRRSVPRPEHGASTRTRSKIAPKGSACAALAWTTRTHRAPAVRTVSASSCTRLRADVREPRACRCRPCRRPSRWSCLPAPRTRRASARRRPLAPPRPRAARPRPARRTAPGRRAGSAGDCRCGSTRPSGAKVRRVRLDAGGVQGLRELVAARSAADWRAASAARPRC